MIVKSSNKQLISNVEEQLSKFVDFENFSASSQTVQPFSLRIMERLAARLELLDVQTPIIQIVGSKGKGTTALLTEALLRAWGLQTGMYHSPHIIDRMERILLNGKVVPVELWLEVAEKVITHANQMPEKPSRFEVETVIAMSCFTHEEISVDVILLESGLGGKGDATSLFPAQITLLTSIELEHTAVLGTRIDQVTHQKIGMLRPKTSLVVGPLPSESMRIIRSHCGVNQISLWEVGVEVAADQVETLKDGLRFVLESGRRKERISKQVSLPCFGLHLPALTALAYGAVEIFAQNFRDCRFPSEYADSLQNIQLPGRMQLLSSAPKILVDAAHTKHSMISTLLSCDAHFSRWPDSVLFAVNQDKDLESLLILLLTHTSTLYLVRNPGTKGVEVDALVEECRSLIQRGIPDHFLGQSQEEIHVKESDVVGYGQIVIRTFEDISTAWNAFQSELEPSEIGLVTGSFRLVGEILRIVEG